MKVLHLEIKKAGRTKKKYEYKAQQRIVAELIEWKTKLCYSKKVNLL